MHKFDYFLLCMGKEAYRSKGWVISAFSVTVGDGPAGKLFLSEVEREIDQLRVRRDAFGRAYFLDLTSGAAVFIEGVLPNEPAFQFKEAVTLTPECAVNLKTTVESTYGAWLFNNILIVYPFGQKIPFSTNGYTISELEKMVEQRLTDNPPAGQEEPTGDPLTLPIYVYEYIRYNEAAGSLTGFTQLCVPAATPFTLSIDPAILVRRDELLEQFKDQLHDPVIQARISAELIELDRAWIAKDPDRGFYFRDKSFEVVRKKLFLFQGSETGFDVAGKFIPQSLDEGVQIESIPDLANVQRNGSFSRGAQTALGGEATKFNLRMFQNSQVVPGDCGSRLGKPVTVTKANFPHMVGSYLLTTDGSTVIAETDAAALIGRDVELRSPMFCRSPESNVCSVCVGDRIASTPDAIATYAADIGSIFMASMMSKMHGKALKTANYDFKSSIR